MKSSLVLPIILKQRTWGSYSSFLESRLFKTNKDEISGLDNQPMLKALSNSSTWKMLSLGRHHLIQVTSCQKETRAHLHRSRAVPIRRWKTTVFIDKNNTKYCLRCQHCCQGHIEPTEEHWKAVKHIMRYIVGTLQFGLLFARSESSDCTRFSDSDLAGDIDDRKSMSGYIFGIGSATVFWGSKKQSCVALSTAEDEYMSLTLAAKEGIWLNRLLA